MGLSREDELKLVRQAQAGSRKALECLIEAFDGLVDRAARKHRGNGLDADDLKQEALICLLKAIQTFDAGRGVRLATYAQSMLDHCMIRCMAKWLQISDGARKYWKRIRNTIAQLCQELQREPTPEEIARACNVPLATVKEVLTVLAHRDQTLDANRSDEGGLTQSAVRAASYSSPPDSRILYEDTIGDLFRNIAHVLGSGNACKLLVLAILHEYEEYNYSWKTIACLLTNHDSDPIPSWQTVLDTEFTCLTELPREWEAVQDLFREPPPTVTDTSLRQWYSRARRELESNWASIMMASHNYI